MSSTAMVVLCIACGHEIHEDGKCVYMEYCGAQLIPTPFGDEIHDLLAYCSCRMHNSRRKRIDLPVERRILTGYTKFFRVFQSI